MGPGLGFEPRQKAPQASRLPSYLTSATLMFVFPFFDQVADSASYLRALKNIKLSSWTGWMFYYSDFIQLKIKYSTMF